MTTPCRWPAGADDFKQKFTKHCRGGHPAVTRFVTYSIAALVAAHPDGPPDDVASYLRSSLARATPTTVHYRVVALDVLYEWCGLPRPSDSPQARPAIDDLTAPLPVDVPPRVVDCFILAVEEILVW